MPENTGENQAPPGERGSDGKFRPGQSGNPSGRPRGSRNRATRLAQDLLDGESEELVRVAIKRAKKGDPIALRLCIERLVPVRRSQAAEVDDLPAIQDAGDVATAAAAIIQAAAKGELSLAEAREWLALLDKQRTAIETRDLAIRLELLEELERDREKRYKRGLTR